MKKIQLFNIETWEQAKPDGIEFTHVYYTKNSQRVRKVKGIITVMREVLLNGERKTVPEMKKAHWDGFGRCYVGIHSIYKREYDIPLK